MNHALLEQVSEIRKCISVPFLGYNESLAHKVAQNLANVVKEVQYSAFTFAVIFDVKILTSSFSMLNR